jgi:hypothetical protein
MTTPSAQVLLGTEIGDPPSTNGASNYASFVAAMGQAPSLVDNYIDASAQPSTWASGSGSYSAWGVENANATYSAHVIPVVGIPMAIAGDNADTDFQAIASGAWDSDLNGVFQDFANDGFSTFYIRPGWEMNGNWEPWSVTPSNAADFVSAFQHIANLAHSFSGANIQVVWNPGYVTSSVSYQSIYPGNQYVDSIGIDTYGAASGVPDTAPFDTSTDPNNFTLNDAIAMAKANGKPLSLPETGAGPGDTAFPANLASVISASGVPVSFVNIWDDSSGGASNLHWSDNAASAAAWTQAFATIAADNSGAATTTPTTPPPPTAPSSPPTATTDTLTLQVSEDAWEGDAQFTVSVNGQQVGGTLTASALQSSSLYGQANPTSDSNVFTLTGQWGTGPQDVQISFINDAYGGTAETDRNLYVNSIAYDGTTYAKTAANMLANGTHDFSVGDTVAAGAAPADTLILHLAEDAWGGNAQFTLSIDGKQVSTPQDVVVLHSDGAWEDLTFAGNFGAGSHTVGVAFTNDAYGGTAATDRNLYVNGIDCNGQHYGSGVTALMGDSTALFTISTTH